MVSGAAGAVGSLVGQIAKIKAGNICKKEKKCVKIERVSGVWP